MVRRGDRNCNRGFDWLVVAAMKRAAFAFAAMVLPVFAQQDSSAPFAVVMPDESTPFFASARQRAFGAEEAEAVQSPAQGYPRVRQAPDGMLKQVGNFFAGILPPLRGGEKKPDDEAFLSVQPESPKIGQDRELDVVYSVKNNSRKMTRLEFPTDQRIEILTMDSGGAVVDRWSDDRSFRPREGLVVLNPNERIEFREKVSTRDMRAGETYTIEAKLASDPAFPVVQTVVPR